MKKGYQLTLFFLLLLLVISSTLHAKAENGYNFELGSRILKNGDEGPDVAILQGKLKELSLYQGRIDGLFGSGTERALKVFQRNNKLTVDGVAGPATYSLLPNKGIFSRVSISRDDIILLARIIHGEARGESFKGMVAVGAVIINRVKNHQFPDTIRGVILQKGQFSSLFDGQANLYPSQEAIDAAKAALLGYDPSRGSLFFYNPKVATNVAWISARPVVIRIGDHIFAS